MPVTKSVHFLMSHSPDFSFHFPFPRPSLILWEVKAEKRRSQVGDEGERNFLQRK